MSTKGMKPGKKWLFYVSTVRRVLVARRPVATSRSGATMRVLAFFALTYVCMVHYRVADLALAWRPGVRSPSSSSSSSSSLAERESFGYFDDIPDAEWRARQRRARTHRHQRDVALKDPNHKGNINGAQGWILNNYYPLFSCPNGQRVGVGGDGPKWVCDPLRLAKKKKEKDGECLVYSVGCHGDYNFEDSLIDLVGNGTCEVHVFDVIPRFDRPNENAARNIHFHPWGLASSYLPDAKKETRAVKTLRETMATLGHAGRTIDVFKIDCEGCEWTTYKDWLRDDVDIRQILVETHKVAEGTGVKASDFFDDLQQFGFALFSKEPNIHPHAEQGLSEWSFVRLDRAFFGSGDSSNDGAVAGR